MAALPDRDLSGRTEQRNYADPLTTTTVAGSVNLLDAVRAEGRSRRLATILMLMAMAGDTTETEKEAA